MLLEVKNLAVYYGSVLALDDVSFRVDEGEIVALIGPNGAGKSTALKAICGLVEAKSDDVLFEAKRINGFQPYQLVKEGLSLVPEGRHVFPTMSVLENLEMGAYTIKKSAADNIKISDSLDKVFQLFPVLKDRLKQKAGTLSSGEQQMLAIGRALMLKPKLLLLDEPSLGLSPNFVEMVFDKLKKINDEGTTILLVEQNAQMALEHSDRGYVFEIGKIGCSGEGKELLNNKKVRKAFLGE